MAKGCEQDVLKGEMVAAGTSRVLPAPSFDGEHHHHHKLHASCAAPFILRCWGLCCAVPAPARDPLPYIVRGKSLYSLHVNLTIATQGSPKTVTSIATTSKVMLPVPWLHSILGQAESVERPYCVIHT